MTPDAVASEAARLLQMAPSEIAWRVLKEAHDRVVLEAKRSIPPSEALIIKWSAYEGYAEHEAAFCSALEHRAGASRVVALGGPAQVVVMTRATGRMADPQSLLASPHLDWLTSALVALHGTPMGAAMQGGRAQVKHPWSIAPRLKYILQLGLITPSKAQAMMTLGHALDSALDLFVSPAVPVHGDACAQNMFVDEPQRCIHLIDFEYATSGDAASDLAFFTTSVAPQSEPRDLWQHVLSSYFSAADIADREAFQSRFLLQQAYQRLFRHIAAHEELLTGQFSNFGSRRAQLETDIALLHERSLLKGNAIDLLQAF